MKVLVAGGAGFVGSHLCRRFVADGHEVVCVDNLITGSTGNIADLRDGPRFTFVDSDVAECPTVDVDLVMHLASPASPVDYERLPLETMWANSLGTKRLLEIASASAARFVYVSTSEAYGDPLVHPQPETYWGNVDPVGPRSCYDEGKRFGEALVTAWRGVHGLPAAIVRVFNTYGPAMRMDDGRVIPELIGAALAGRPLPLHGDGHQTRSFMYVSDLVEALATVGQDVELDGLLLNIGNPEEVTIAELATRIQGIVGGPSGLDRRPARAGDPQQRCPDITRIRERYGWLPRVPLDEGLRLTIAAYLADGAADDTEIHVPEMEQATTAR